MISLNFSSNFSSNFFDFRFGHCSWQRCRRNRRRRVVDSIGALCNERDTIIGNGTHTLFELGESISVTLQEPRRKVPDFVERGEQQGRHSLLGCTVDERECTLNQASQIGECSRDKASAAQHAADVAHRAQNDRHRLKELRRATARHASIDGKCRCLVHSTLTQHRAAANGIECRFARFGARVAIVQPLDEHVCKENINEIIGNQWRRWHFGERVKSRHRVGQSRQRRTRDLFVVVVRGRAGQIDNE